MCTLVLELFAAVDVPLAGMVPQTCEKLNAGPLPWSSRLDARLFSQMPGLASDPSLDELVRACDQARVPWNAPCP